MDLCQYKGIFGEPGVGAHSYRIPVVDLAMVDVAGTFLLAYLLNKIFKISYVKMLLICFISGIALHKLFCVDTKINGVLFGKK